MSASSDLDDLEHLAEIVSSSAKVIKTFLASNNIPQPSFLVDTSLGFPSDVPEDVQVARRELREASSRIHDLATGPIESTIWLSTRYNDCSTMQYIYDFKIAEAVPLESTVTFSKIAHKTKTDESRTRRVLRYAMTNRLFHEPAPGQVAHTAASRCFLMPGVSDLLGYSSEDVFPGAAKLVEQARKHGDSEELNHAPFNMAHNTDAPALRYFSEHPVKGPRFARAMQTLSAGEGHSVKHLLTGYDWPALGEAKVVDVGGGYGQASIAIAEIAPKLKFVVQDLPDIVEQAQGTALQGREELQMRIAFEAHDFFTPQPEGLEADVFLLRFILHDYPDKYARNIIENLLPALQHNAGSRLVVMDSILPQPGAVPPSEERTLRTMDMLMMTLLNAKERELGEWEQLFQAADPRLKVGRVQRPEGSAMSVMEVYYG